MRFFARPAGVTYDEMKTEKNVTRGQLWIAHPVQHRADCHRAYIRARLVNGGQGYRQQARVLNVVDAGHPNFTRHGDAEFIERLQQVCSCEIVCANETVRIDLVENGFGVLFVIRLHASNVRF